MTPVLAAAEFRPSVAHGTVGVTVGGGVPGGPAVDWAWRPHRWGRVCPCPPDITQWGAVSHGCDGQLCPGHSGSSEAQAPVTGNPEPVS